MSLRLRRSAGGSAIAAGRAGVVRRWPTRRSAARCALVSGSTGVVANAFLAGYFALAAPATGLPDGPFEWFGPANDIIGSLSMAALIPVICYVRRRVPADRVLGGLSVAALVASGALAAAGPLLVAGAITLQAQFVVAGLGLPVIFGWLWRAGRAARRSGRLPARVARFGEVVGLAALVATGVAAVGVALPAGSAAQVVVLGAAALPGLPAYLAFPVWLVLAGRAWRGTEGRRASVVSTPVGSTALRGAPE